MIRFLGSHAFAAISLLLLLAATEGIYLSAEFRVNGDFGLGLDDSWIHATFAKNLAEGKGYCLNAGEPVSGSTAPLYTLLLAAWYFIFGELIWGAKILGILGLAVACVFLYLAVERLSGERFVPWLSAALCIVSPPLLWSSLNGMEIAVYIVTPCLAFYLCTLHKYRWMALVLALGVWLRPEAGLLLALGWLAIPARQKVATLLIAAAFLLPYFALNLSLGNYPLPGTVHVKSSWQSAHFTIQFIDEAIPLFSQAHFFPVFLVFPWGFRALWSKAWWIALWPPLLFFVIWSLSVSPQVAGRWLYPMLPFLYATLAFSVIRFIQWRPASILYVKGGALVLLAIQLYVGMDHATTHALSVENINDMQVSIAKTIPQITMPSDTIATNDIGALGYFSKRYILDLVGLTSPIRSFEENLRRIRPAMLVIFDSWFPERLTSPTFRDDYRLLGQVGLQRNVVCGDSVMSLYGRKDRFDDILSRIPSVEPAR